MVSDEPEYIFIWHRWLPAAHYRAGCLLDTKYHRLNSSLELVSSYQRTKLIAVNDFGQAALDGGNVAPENGDRRWKRRPPLGVVGEYDMPEHARDAEKGADCSDDESSGKRLTNTGKRPFGRVTDEPRPAEVANELDQHPLVRDIDVYKDDQVPEVVATLTEDVDSVPWAVVATIYARRCSLTDVSSRAGRKHLRVVARPEGWSA